MKNSAELEAPPINKRHNPSTASSLCIIPHFQDSLTMHTVTILYPNESGITFDEDYYMKTHMPLVDRLWRNKGLIDARVSRFSADLTGERPQYLIMAILDWESEEVMKTTMQIPASAEVFNDIPNFTNVKPVTLAGGPRHW